MRRNVICCVIMMALLFAQALPVNAMTVYESDGIYHDEGYIFVGESHAVKSAIAFGDKASVLGNSLLLGNGETLTYELRWDDSVAVTPEGDANTFTMKGNLFFVFEGIAWGTDGAMQSSTDYIYSDGKGKQGRAVQKIHEIIDKNPNIAHWNIISMHGASAAGKGKAAADSCASSYKNWVAYEFPEADCYFLSVATMIKFYRRIPDKKVYNDTLAAAFPDAFLDYTDFYEERNPDRLVDTIHWDDATYIDLLTDVILQIGQRRVSQDTITQMQEILYTNDTCVIYSEPSLESTIILPACEKGIPILVTGRTGNGFYQISLGEGVYYIPETGLTADIGE